MDEPEIEADVDDIERFCKRNKMSRGFFYKILREGRGPRVIRLGSRIRISHEAGAEWRRQMEQDWSRPQKPSTNGTDTTVAPRLEEMAWADRPVTSLELSTRARGHLKQMRIRTLRQLVRTSEEKLLARPGFGRKSLYEIEKELARHGLHFGMAIPQPDREPPRRAGSGASRPERTARGPR